MTPWQSRQAVRALRLGGVIAYPTETVYGLGCDPLDYEAVERLLKLKQRPMAKGLILIGADIEQLDPYIEVSDAALLDKLPPRPGEPPTTWLAPARADVPHWLSGGRDTIAVRITSSPVAAAVCEGFGGAVVSTSANPGGLTPAHNALKVRSYFAGALDYILHADTDRFARPSRICDLLSGAVFR